MSSDVLSRNSGGSTGDGFVVTPYFVEAEFALRMRIEIGAVAAEHEHDEEFGIHAREGRALLSAVRLPHLGPGEVARFYFTTEQGDCRSKRSDAEVVCRIAPDAETTRERRAANSTSAI